MSAQIRKLWTRVEEIRTAAGRDDGDGPLRKVAACAVVANPLAGQGFVADPSPLVDASAELGTLLGSAGAALCGPAESYGKAAIVGVNGEQEHGDAMLTSAFGDAGPREPEGRGIAWTEERRRSGEGRRCLVAPRRRVGRNAVTTTRSRYGCRTPRCPARSW